MLEARTRKSFNHAGFKLITSPYSKKCKIVCSRFHERYSSEVYLRQDVYKPYNY